MRGEVGLDRRGGMMLMVTVMLVLAGLSLSQFLPRAQLGYQREKEQRLRLVLRDMRSAAWRFEQRNGRPPLNLLEMLQDDQGRRFLRRIVPDPITGQNDWQVRSDASGFDVRSGSVERSIAGSPYRDW